MFNYKIISIEFLQLLLSLSFTGSDIAESDDECPKKTSGGKIKLSIWHLVGCLAQVYKREFFYFSAFLAVRFSLVGCLTVHLAQAITHNISITIQMLGSGMRMGPFHFGVCPALWFCPVNCLTVRLAESYHNISITFQAINLKFGGMLGSGMQNDPFHFGVHPAVQFCPLGCPSG